MFVRLPLTTLLLLALVGCATTVKDYKAAEVKPDEGTIIGKVKIVYNGKDFSDQCFVCFNSVNGPCYKLEKDGQVIMRIKAGNTSIKRIACIDVSEQHYHMNGADFAVVPGSKHYFGDVVFHWKNAGGFKVSSMFGLVGALIDQSANNGSLKMTVSSNTTGASSAYRKIAGQSDKSPIKTTLVKGIL